MGLIKCGTVVIPFDNQISKDTDLYKLYNTNIHEKIEMQKAKELLEDTMVNIKDVSSSVGYRDSNYFAKVFKRMTGCTPSDYRFKVLQNKKQDGK